MRILLLGAAGFIGTNIVNELAKKKENRITVVDKDKRLLCHSDKSLSNISYLYEDLSNNFDFEKIVAHQDIVYHLISTTVPTTSNQAIGEELSTNIILSANLFDACVHQNVKKVIFLSSGGTVYGRESLCPINEESQTNPISSYGIQKITIEKLLYLYNYLYGLDYRIVRLSNPYGPYQKPNGIQGAVTTFIYKALKGEDIIVYGDGSIIRDFIFIDDAVRGILNIVNGDACFRTFNLGYGIGTSIRQVIDTITRTLKIKVNVKYTAARKVDVPVNFLDITRYERIYGNLHPIPLEEGIIKTADFIKQNYLD